MNNRMKKIMDIPKVEKSVAYDMGLDCGLNGANTTNCHFSIFADKENTKEWERGKRDSENIYRSGGVHPNVSS